MSKIAVFMKGLKEKIKDSILRFPATILCLCIIYVLIDVRRYTSIVPNDKLFLVLSYGVLATFIVDILLENLKQTNIRFRLICYFLTYLVLQVAYFFVNTKIGPNSFIFACLMSLAVAVLYNKERGKFETNLAQILVGEFVATFFTLVLAVGVLLILFSIDLLLVEISSKAYIECLQMASLIVFPILFLGEIPKIGESLEYPSIIKKLLRFIELPLLMVFTVVLYAYYGKLAFTRDFITEELIAISTVFLGAAVSTLILITPFDEKLPKFARKWGVFLLIPVDLVLAFAAICNIRELGITYIGYAAIACAITAIIEIVLIWLKDGKYQYTIFLVAAVASIVYGFGPINMFKLTTISQQKILTTTLEKNGMLKNNKIIPNSSISKEDKNKILDSIQYLKKNDLELPNYYKKQENMSDEEVFGFSRYSFDDSAKWENFTCQDSLIDITGYKYFTKEKYISSTIETEKGTVRIELNNGPDEKWFIYLNDEPIFEMKYSDICDYIYNNVKGLSPDECTQDKMSYVYNSDKINLKVTYNFIEYSQGKVEFSDYMVLLNLPD